MFSIPPSQIPEARDLPGPQELGGWGGGCSVALCIHREQLPILMHLRPSPKGAGVGCRKALALFHAS